MRKFNQTAIVLFVCLVLFPVWAVAMTGTIVTKDNQRYESVNFSAKDAYQIITIKLEQGNKNLSFHQIAIIYDESGEDVTQLVIGRPASPVEKKTETPVQNITPTVNDAADSSQTVRDPFEEQWLSVASPDIKKAKEKYWSTGIRMGGNFSIPIGDYYEGITSGIGYGGEFLIAATKDIAIKFTISKSGMKVGDDFLDMIIANGQLLDNNVDITTMRYILSAMYYRPVNRMRPEANFFYFSAGLGMVSHNISGNFTFRELPGDDIYWASVDDYSETKFAMSGSLGEAIMIAKKIALDFCFSYDIVFIGSDSNNDYYSEMQRALILDFRAGLLFLF